MHSKSAVGRCPPGRLLRQGWKLRGLFLLLALMGCGRGREEQGASPPRILTEHRVTDAGSGHRLVGEDCGSGSHSDCVSGLCLHASSGGPARPDTGYVCSRACRATLDCPVDWRCQQVLPDAPERVCVPPQGWTASEARARPQPAEMKAPRP